MSMQPDQIRDSLRSQPFFPFVVHLADGRHFLVPHPDFAMLSKSGRTLYVVDDGEIPHRIDTLMVTSVSGTAPRDS